MGLGKKEQIENTRIIIQKLGELPLIYNGNLDIITNKIEDLKKNILIIIII